MLLKVMSSLMYLLKQGLSIRGHREEDGNLMQLLYLRSIWIVERAQGTSSDIYWYA